MHKLPPEPIQPLLEALANPIRAQVLAVLTDRSASAAKIAEIIDEPIGKVRYHLRALAKAELIGWEEAKDRRGTREYYWVARTRQMIEDEQYAEMTPEQIRLVSLYDLRLMFGDATAALREGAFSRRADHLLTRHRPEVDEKGWKELVKVFRTAVAGVEKASERASKRLADSGEKPVTVSAMLLLFDLEAPARHVPATIPPPE